MKMNNKAQMMVLESVVFSIAVIISIAFLFQITPTSTLSDQYTKELKIQGDDALASLYFATYEDDSLSTNYPKSKLINYLIAENGVTDLINDLNKILVNKEYNIRISDGDKTIFWCNSFGDTATPLVPKNEISSSHCIVSIHPYFIDDSSKLETELSGNTFKVILELWSLE